MSVGLRTKWLWVQVQFLLLNTLYIQRRLSYFFIYNVLQESVKNPDVLAAFSTDHSPIMFSLFSKSEGTRGKGLWEHNDPLCEKSKYINSIKKHHIYLRKPQE